MFARIKRLFHSGQFEQTGTWHDGSNHSLPYVFRPARRKGAPLLLILHGNGNNRTPGKFHSTDYNVLLPLDQYGIRQNGCWFLGENGDFFVYNMLLALVQEVRKNLDEAPIYIWGSSMGGYAAILLGLRLQAEAVFAHIPQTNLYDSHWYIKNRPFIDLVFGSDFGRHPFRDLAGVVNAHRGVFPLFFLSFNRFDRPSYNEEHLTPFIDFLNRRALNYLLLIHPCEGHNLVQKSADLIKYFSIYANEIRQYRSKQTKIGG